jgi:hypothetical protein
LYPEGDRGICVLVNNPFDELSQVEFPAYVFQVVHQVVEEMHIVRDRMINKAFPLTI